MEMKGSHLANDAYDFRAFHLTNKERKKGEKSIILGKADKEESLRFQEDSLQRYTILEHKINKNCLKYFSFRAVLVIFLV